MTTTTITLSSGANYVGESYPTLSSEALAGYNYVGQISGQCVQVPNPGTPPPAYVPLYYLGLRFSLPIDQGEEIAAATLRVFIRFGADYDRPWHTIQAQASDNAPAFVGDPVGGPYSHDLSLRTLGAALVTWGDGTDLGLADHDPVDIPIGSLLQEVVNRPGWVSGNHVVLVIKPVDDQSATAQDHRIQLDPYTLNPVQVEFVVDIGAAVLGAAPAVTAAAIVERPSAASLQASASLAAAGFVDSAHAALSATAALTAVATVSHEWTATAVLAAAASAPMLAVASWAAASVATAQADVVARPTHRSAFADYPAMPTSARPALRPGVGSARSNLRPRPGTARMEW